MPLVVLVTLLGGEGGLADLGIGFAKALGLIAAMVTGFYLFSNHVLPRLLGALNLSKNRELLILLAAVLAMGSAGVAHQLHISPALGAFIAGMMLAESPFATQIRSDISALRVLFLTLVLRLCRHARRPEVDRPARRQRRAVRGGSGDREGDNHLSDRPPVRSPDRAMR